LGKQLLVVGQCGLRPHFLEVVPGTKSLTGSGQHDHTGMFVLRNGVQGLLQSIEQGFAEGVEAAGTVEGQPVNATGIALVEQQVS
jgi:hypothetical protein